MFVFITNTHRRNKAALMGYEAIVTGLIGVFDTKEKVDEVWKEKLKDMNVKEDTYGGDWFTYKHAFIPVNKDGKYVNEKEPEFLIELMVKEAEINNVMKLGD